METNFRPLSNKVLVKRDANPTQTPGGLYIPPSAQEESGHGVVVATGPGKNLEDGSVQKMNVNSGDSIIFGKYTGVKIKVENSEFLIMGEDDILGVLENK